MILLILALIFGIAVLVFLLMGLKRAKKNGSGKFVTILRLAVLAETLIYLGLFIFVFVKTMAM